MSSVKKEIKKLKNRYLKRSNSQLHPTTSIDNESDDEVDSPLVTPTSTNLPTTHVGMNVSDGMPSASAIAAQESATSSVSGSPAQRPSKRFAPTSNAQQDIAVLHVAYILRNSTNLQSLIVEILKLNQKPGFKDMVQTCVDFATQLIAALDSPTVVQASVDAAIAMFYRVIETVNSKYSDPKEESTDIEGSPNLKETSQEIERSIVEIKDAHPDILGIVTGNKHPSNFSKVTSKVLGVALPMLGILEKSSTMIPVPMVEPLIGVVAGFLQAAEQARNNFEWMRWLSATSAECVVGIAIRCPQRREENWDEAIATLRGKLAEIVEKAVKFCTRPVSSRFLQQSRDKGNIEVIKEDLKAAMSNFNSQVLMNIRLDFDNVSRKIDELSIQSLPALDNDFLAAVSADNHFQADRRTEMTDTLDWIESPDSGRFFWVYGAPGVGKSTLARRLINHLKNEGILATFAAFVISTDVKPKDLVRMMARELASLHPGCRADIAHAINECYGVHQSLDDYLNHFLINPIKVLTYAGPLVVVFDGLDEWSAQHRQLFLQAFRRVKLPPTLSLKFVMTSRRLEDIESIIGDVAELYPSKPVSDDICQKYFEQTFKSFPWDGLAPNDVKERIVKLVKLAEGLLIWAATVCTLVSTEDPDKRPLEILDDIISSSSTSLGDKSTMEVLYQQALGRIFPSDASPRHKDSRIKVFLSMIALKETLPVTQFACFVDKQSRFVLDINSRLRAFQTRGTFDKDKVQPATELFHASFIQHLDRSNEAHDVMADNCIHFMKRMNKPGTVRDPDPFLLRQTAHYLFEHWLYHLQELLSQKAPNLFLELFIDNWLRLWVEWLLSQLVRRKNCDDQAGSDTSKRLSDDDLANIHGISHSSPLIFLKDTAKLKRVARILQQALELVGLDHQKSYLYPQKQDDALRWALIINALAIVMQRLGMLTGNQSNCVVAVDLLDNLIKTYPSNIQRPPFLLGNLTRTLSEFTGSEAFEEDFNSALEKDFVSQGRRRALLIGVQNTSNADCAEEDVINQYRKEIALRAERTQPIKLYKQWSFEAGPGILKGPHRDVLAMKKLLIEKYNYDPRDITVLIDADDSPEAFRPTILNITRNIKQMVRNASPMDRFVFHYIGHSSQEPTDDSFEGDDIDEFLFTSDGFHMMDDELTLLLVDPLPVGSCLTAIMDCCHSGALLDLAHHICNRVYLPWRNKGYRARAGSGHWYGGLLILQQSIPASTGSTSSLDRTDIQHLTARSSQLIIPSVEGFSSGTQATSIEKPNIKVIIPPAAPATFLDSPQRQFDSPIGLACNGFCRTLPFLPAQIEPKAYVVCISACEDKQVSWADHESSMTQSLVRTLGDDPHPTLHRLLRTISHESYAFYINSIQNARAYRKRMRMLDRGREGSSHDIKPEKYDFQNPQISSHAPLDMQSIFDP